MAKRFLLNLVLEYGTRVGKSVYNAYLKSVSGKSLSSFISIGASSGPASQSGFGKAAKETLGRFVAKPMTREEACKILNVEEVAELDPAEVMKVNHNAILILNSEI
jgi:hypothetical protein